MPKTKMSTKTASGNKPRILTLDVETAPGEAYIWSMWDKFIPMERMKRPGRMITWAAKWLGSREVMHGAEWEGEDWLDRLAELMVEADAIVTYNGDHFDFGNIRRELVKRGYKPFPMPVSIDLIKTAKTLRLMSNRLGYLAQELGIGSKMHTGGFRLWVKVLEGDEKARAKMIRYNKQDVVLTEKVYVKLRPWITNHPFLGQRSPRSCPVCGSKHVQHRGMRRTRAFKVERLQCQSCGHWFPGVRRKVQ